MKVKTVFLILIIVLGLNTYAQKGKDLKHEKELIKQTIRMAYVDGLLNEGNFDKVDAGFHPQFEIRAMTQEQQLWVLDLAECKAIIQEQIDGGKIPRPKNEEVNIKFLDIDVTGYSASAKFEFYYGRRLAFVDYMLLYRFGDEWQIINKIYYHIPK